MKLPRCASLVTILSAAVCFPALRAADTPTPVMAPAPATAAGPRWIDPAKFDFAKLVPPPPAADSAAGHADLRTLLDVQQTRTEADIAWAKVAERDSIWNHAEIVGPWFTAQNLPVTAAFFAALSSDLRAIDGAMKQPFLRPRPGVANSRIQPCVEKPKSTSYPSGTAMQAIVWAEFLSELFPEHRDALFARAGRIGWGRVIGGVHYPSDLAAGRAIGVVLIAFLRADESFTLELARCKAEIEAWRAKAEKPAPKAG